MRPEDGLAVDVLLEQPLAQHQPEGAPRPPPGGVRRLVDDVQQVVEAARIGRLAHGQPFFARTPALPRPGGEAEDLHLHPAALQRAGEDLGAHRRHRDGPPAHGAGVVDQQGDHGVPELRLLLLLEGERRRGIDDHPGEPRSVEDALLEVELPAALLLGQEQPLQPVGHAADHALVAREVGVELGAQARELARPAQLLGHHLRVELGGEDAVCQRLAARRDVARPVGGRFVLPLLATGQALARLRGLGFGRFLCSGLLFAALLLAPRLLLRLLAGIGLLRPAHLPRGRLLALIGLLLGRVLRRRFVQLVGEPQPHQQLAHPPGEGLLALEVPGEPGQDGGHVAFQPLPPALELQLLGGGGLEAEQPLAHEQVDHRRQRHVLLLGQQRSLAQPVEGLEVLPHPRPAPASQRLDPDLLEALEDVGGDLAGGSQPAVEDGIVEAQPQRQPVGLAAHPRHLEGREVLAGRRDVDGAGGAVLAAGVAAAQQHLHVVAPAERPQRRSHRALEALQPLLALACRGRIAPVVAHGLRRARSARPTRAGPRRSSAGSIRRRCGAPPRRTC
ncbi:hypothetical protein HRbin39_01480 [bacterium HR39]|nr:hypothetical protein HRbin39_01480 [bacterium HR39]